MPVALTTAEAHRESNAGARYRSKPGVMVLVVTVSHWLTVGIAVAQTFGAVKGFKVAEPFPSPHEKQTKSLLQGGNAVFVPGGAMLSDGVLLQTFSETNTPQMIVRAEHCFYNSTNHTVNSAGPLHMQTADGRFILEGEGFYWQQTNSSLIVSNNVHTTIEAGLFQPAVTNRTTSSTSATNGPLFIRSEKFSYDGTSGRALWRENVQVSGTNQVGGTNLALSSATLTAEVPLDQRQVRSLLAEKQVIADYNGVHATGERFNYDPQTGLLRILQDGTWQIGQRQGGGNELVIDPTNRVLQAKGKAWLKLAGQGVADSGLLGFSNSPAREVATNIQRWVDIECNNYEIRTNIATFHESVRLEEHLDQSVRSRMSCQFMTATFGTSNELQTMVADKKVLIEQTDNQEVKRFTGGHAVYTHTNTTLVMTQNPTWRAGTREGKGDRLQLNTRESELLVSGNASLRLPAGELAGQLSPTNRVGQVRSGSTSTNQVAEIYCREYRLRPESSVFLGGVYVTHPEMNWSCEKLTVQVPAPGLTNLVALGGVAFDLTTQKEGTVHGTSDHADYYFGTFDTMTNGQRAINELHLTGVPASLTNVTKAIGVQDHIIIWDRLTDKAILPGGEYKIQGTGPAVNTTNTLLLPKKKQAK